MHMAAISLSGFGTRIFPHLIGMSFHPSSVLCIHVRDRRATESLSHESVFCSSARLLQQICYFSSSHTEIFKAVKRNF